MLKISLRVLRIHILAELLLSKLVNLTHTPMCLNNLVFYIQSGQVPLSQCSLILKKSLIKLKPVVHRSWYLFQNVMQSSSFFS